MNLTRFDALLTTTAGICAIVGGTTAFAGLVPIWMGVMISFVGVIAGALATSPMFSAVPGSAWNRAFQGLTAVFAAAAGSSQLEAVQKLIMPAHPALAAKLGLGVMLGAQVFAYLAQRTGAGGPAKLALLAVFMALPVSGCAAVVSQLPAIVAYVQDAEIVLHTIQAVMDAVWAAHPDAGNQALVDQAIARCLTAADVVNRAAQGGEAVNQGQIDAAFSDFEAAFNDLMSIVGPYGVHVGDVPKAIRTPNGGVIVPRPLLCAKVRR